MIGIYEKEGVKILKRFSTIFIIIVALALIAAGCGTQKANVTFNKKNTPLPDYVLNSSKMVQETYIMASNYPDVLNQVQCFCGCAADGHKSNLNCFVGKMGSNNAVQAWDQHGIS
jgi:hypothetical protein